MRPFDLSAELPQFASEAASDADPALAELLAELSLVVASDVSETDVAPGRARLLAAVAAGPQRFAPWFGQLSAFFDLSAEALLAVFTRAERASEWEPGPLPWVSLLHFAGGPAVANLDTGLVRLKKGMPFPAHRHTAAERVLILEGSYRDHEQRLYRPGDIHEMAAGSEHALQMSAEEDVLLAVILSGEIEVVGASR